jgi:Mrp family chromosome partitioning ATPase/DUF971 family protein
MSEDRKQAVLTALSVIQDPDLNDDIVSLGFVTQLDITDGGVVSLTLNLTTPACPVKTIFESDAKRLVSELSWVTAVNVTMTATSTGMKAMGKGLAKVANIIAVSSCKGGVGKSTVAVNLAYALSKLGAKVGIFDADVYGPSLPTMVAVDDTQLFYNEGFIEPPSYHGVKLMSFAYTQDAETESSPAMMRGPMVSQVVNQLLTGTNWGGLDYLVLDLPPGTGDIQLTLAQLIPITAAVIVTTPQKISFVDVVKGIEMFDKLSIPSVAIVENMSYFLCDGCDKQHYIFGRGALQSLVYEFGFSHVIELPVDAQVSPCGDSGVPLVIGYPESAIAKKFETLAGAVAREVSKLVHLNERIPVAEYIPAQGIVLRHGENSWVVPAAVLRSECRCARCQDEFTGERRVFIDNVPESIAPVGMSPVGNYALGINWNDGHSSIFPYAQLKEIAAQSAAVR